MEQSLGFSNCPGLPQSGCVLELRRNAAKTDYYVQKALKLDPDDGYNLVSLLALWLPMVMATKR